MKKKSLSTAFIIVLPLFVIICCMRTSFSLSPMDKFNNEKDWIPENNFDIFSIEEPSVEDIFRGRNPVHLKIPHHIETILTENNFVPWKSCKFVYLCKKLCNSSRCPMNGLTIFISTIFIRKDNVTNNIIRVEIRSNPCTGKVNELIIKSGDRFWTMIFKEIKI